jgi:hypothetical protein
MWRHILSKLSLQEHARVAPTSRDFRKELIARVAEGRVACILAAEATLGKGLFCGFVTAVQRLLCGMGPYPCGPQLEEQGAHVIVNAAGKAEYVGQEEADKRWFTDKEVAYMCQYHCSCPLHAELCPTLPGKADIIISVHRHRRNMLHVSVYFTKEKAAAATGLMLAICTGNPEATPSHWKMDLGGITLEQFSRVDAGPPPLASRPASAMQHAYRGVMFLFLGFGFGLVVGGVV